MTGFECLQTVVIHLVRKALSFKERNEARHWKG